MNLKLGLAVFLTVQSTAVLALPSESICLLFGEQAEAAAQSRQTGLVTEKMLHKTLDDSLAELDKTHTSKAAKARNRRLTESQKLAVSYVYTMGYAPADARKMVYIKCKQGDFE